MQVNRLSVWEPKSRTAHFFRLSLSNHSFHQEDKLSMSDWRLMMFCEEIICLNSFTSPAYKQIFESLMTEGKSFKYIKKSIVLMTDPCGIPLEHLTGWDWTDCILTVWVRSERKSLIYARHCGWIEYENSFQRSLRWEIESKALLRSKKTQCVWLPVRIEVNRSKVVDSNAERLEQPWRKPCWKGDIKNSEVKWESMQAVFYYSFYNFARYKGKSYWSIIFLEKTLTNTLIDWANIRLLPNRW